MSNESFINAIKKKPQNIPPVWFMRQAGRYHSHYQDLRKKYSFMELCKIPEIAAQVALGPVKEFDFDAAILFSDILFPLEAIGFRLEYTDKGPQFYSKLNSREQLMNVKSLEESIAFMNFQKEALVCTRSLLADNKSLIGFVGGIWTLFTYIVDGTHNKSIQSKMSLELYELFLPLMQDFIIRNIELQISAGAEVVMIFDTSAGDLSPILFEKCVIPYLIAISNKFPKKIIYYAKNSTNDHIDLILKVNQLLGFGIDHRFNIQNIFLKNSFNVTQGNFDQNLLFMEKVELENTFKEYLKPIKDIDIKDRAGWVFGLGHGILPKTPEYNVKMIIDLVRSLL